MLGPRTRRRGRSGARRPRRSAAKCRRVARGGVGVAGDAGAPRRGVVDERQPAEPVAGQRAGDAVGEAQS